MLSALLLVEALSAQNIDPTVIVRREYEGKLMEVHKPALEMAVPDSVQRFNLEFDYSVFDSPYKGAYEFRPYQLVMRPAADRQKQKTLYLRAGAGYTLHPELDVVWSPVLPGKFRLDVYGLHRSYVGKYRTIAPVDPSDGFYEISRWEGATGSARTWNGYDLLSKAGVNGAYDWEKMSFRFDVGYYGIAQKDQRRGRCYDALDVRMDFMSNVYEHGAFLYDIDMDYRFAEDKLKDFSMGPYLGEHDFSLKASLAPVFGPHSFFFDVRLDMTGYSGALNAVAGRLGLTPRYVFDRGRWKFDLGVNLSAKISEDNQSDLYSSKEQYVYPDVSVEYRAIRNAMVLYADVAGGSHLDTYSDLIASNHHADFSYSLDGRPVLDMSVERVNAALGMKGRIASGFSYDLRAGYANVASAPLDAVVLVGDRFRAGLAYTPYQKWYAALDWLWKNERISFDGSMRYIHAWGIDEELLAPAAFAGNAAFKYNWSGRIYAGVDCRFSTARRGNHMRLPGYADLGLTFEYLVSKSFSVWARGGNLLHMTVQESPLYAEQGINFTVGICLNL